MTGHPHPFSPRPWDTDSLTDAMRQRVADRDRLVREAREVREPWDLERTAGVLREGMAAALGIPVHRSSITPWRTVYAMRGAGAEVRLILGDAVRFPHALGGGDLDVAERTRREVLLDVREQVHAAMRHVDPKADERRRADTLTRELFG